MDRSIRELLTEVNAGRMTRRQLIQAFGIAAVAAVPMSAFAQGGAGGGAAGGGGGAGAGAGAGAAGTGGRGGGGGRAQRDTTPLKLPFESTGWKTVWLDHFTYQCTDYEKAAAFYVAAMGWKVRSDDGKQAVLDLGDASGSVIIRGGLAAPAPAAITDAGLGADKKQITAIWDGFAWGIDQWDEKKVKAELEKRGLNPVADNSGDFKSFHIKDPDGFNLWITNGTRENRRKTPANGKLRGAPAPFKPTDFKTLYIDHISYEVSDPAPNAAFYSALLGWTVRSGGGDMNVQIGDVAGAIIRGNAAYRARGRAGADGTAVPKLPAAIGHISFGIDNWDRDRVKAELIERDVCYDIKGQRIPRDDFTGTLQSYHVPDAMNWDLQIGNKIKP